MSELSGPRLESVRDLSCGLQIVEGKKTDRVVRPFKCLARFTEIHVTEMLGQGVSRLGQWLVAGGSVASPAAALAVKKRRVSPVVRATSFAGNVTVWRMK